MVLIFFFINLVNASASPFAPSQHLASQCSEEQSFFLFFVENSGIRSFDTLRIVHPGKRHGYQVVFNRGHGEQHCEHENCGGALFMERIHCFFVSMQKDHH